MKRYILFIALFVFSLTSNADYMASFRLINGMFIYDSEVLSGSSSTLVSPGFYLHKKVADKHYLGLSGEIHFNVTESTTSLYAFGINYRYYLKGDGSIETVGDDENSISTKEKLSYYVLGSINKYEYFLGANNTEEDYDQNGTFVNIDAGGGVDYAIYDDYRVFAEGSYSILSFAASDDRIKLRGFLISIGITREF